MSEHEEIREREEGRHKMPIGMTVLFTGLVLFGLVYIYRYTPQTTGWTQTGQYEQRMGAHKAEVVTHEVKEVEAGMSESGSAAEGSAIYKKDCAMCHGENLEGGIGPALTGPKFIHGNTLADHARVIADGTPNGMPGFGKQLGPAKVRAVAHYIHFRHTK